MTERAWGILRQGLPNLVAVLSCLAFLFTSGCAHDSHGVGKQPDVTSPAAAHEHLPSEKESNIARSDEPIHLHADTPSEVSLAVSQDLSNSPDATCDTCLEARIHNGWCASCSRGFVAGLTIESEELFEALDAHGHIVGPNGLTCDSCLQAIPHDGYCQLHGWGFVDDKMYVTKMTWILARGTIDEPDQLTCSQCRADCEHRGWCEACGVGHVGAVRFASRDDFERAARQQDRLGLALVTLKRCEECSMRTFYGGICQSCGTDSQTLPGYMNPEDSTMTEKNPLLP